MAGDLWVISDTHLNHRNMLNFRDHVTGNLIRSGFDSIEEMNEYIIEQWNSLVKPGDKVIHCGDVFMGPKEEFVPMWKRLHGSKQLILGNHDDAKFFAKHELVTKILVWKPMHEHGIMLSHVPLHETQLRRGVPGKEHEPEQPYLFNVIGHIHSNPAPPGPYRCVCVEQTDYKPVHIETLAAEAKYYNENQLEKAPMHWED